MVQDHFFLHSKLRSLAIVVKSAKAKIYAENTEY